LYLAENEIWEIPESVAGLQRLEVHWLWNNEIEGTHAPELPGEVGQAR